MVDKIRYKIIILNYSDRNMKRFCKNNDKKNEKMKQPFVA